MKPFVRILLSALLSLSCAAFDVTIPDHPLVDKTFRSQLNASKDDFDKASPTGVISIVLIVPPTTDFTCSNGTGVAPDFGNGVDGFSSVRKPGNASELSGELLLTPQRTGPHILCAYAKVSPPPDNSPPSGNRGRGRGPEGFENAVLLYASSQFEVESSGNGASDTTSTSTTPPMPTSTGKDNEGGRHNKSETAAIVGGVAGGIPVVCIFVVVLWMRKRFRHRVHHDFTIEGYSARPASLTPYPLSIEVPARELHQQRTEVERHPNNSDRHTRDDEQTRREGRVVHHKDSGLRPLGSSAGTLSGSESVIHMPPTYSEANFRP